MMMLRTLVLLAALASSSSAFQARSGQPRSTSALFSAVPQVDSSRPIKDIEYGEASRQYRRTVYSHEDWVKHRSSDRFFRNLAAMPTSGVYKGLAKEVLAVTAVATFVCVWNGLTGGFVGLDGVKQEAILGGLTPLTLPLNPFTLSSPSLGLLLGTC